ncbi:MAG: hypothetical protein K2M31_01865, partial [Muribaculaceae bacterium]|nr:hypothetical protein [Muribaculaceae bacterium]
KNYIDTTDFRVLQPAIDYYESHGTPDQRLKTRYYQGRIFMNRGEDGKAFDSFLHAAEDTTGCTDRTMTGLLYIAHGSMYWREYQYDEYIKCNQQAARIFKSMGDTLRYTGCMIRILGGADLNSDQNLMNEVFPDCIKGIFRYGYNRDNLSIIISAFSKVRPKAEFVEFINRIDDPEIFHSVAGYIANAFYQYDDLSMAEKFMTQTDESDPIYNAQTRIVILKETGNLTGALEAYDDYLREVEKEINGRMENNILFARKQYELELQSMKALLNKEKTINIVSCIALVSVIICMIIFFLYRQTMMKRRLAEAEIENLRMSIARENDELGNILKDNHQLSARMRHLLTTHVRIANDLLGELIMKGKLSPKSFEKLKKGIHENKEKFLKGLLSNYQSTHPVMMKYLEEHGLDEYEQKIVCLYALRLRGKDVVNFLDKKSHYNDVAIIRGKLIGDSETIQFRDYVQTCLLNLDEE